MISTRQKILQLRAKEPDISGSALARRLDVSRQRIAQILEDEGLPQGKGGRLQPADRLYLRREYICWWNMRDRCINPKNKTYRMPSKQEVDAATKVIRARCCRAADGRDIRETESFEIATAVLRAAENAANK